jgi:hypothetical protein
MNLDTSSTVVDMNLASSYIPALTAITKVLCLLFVLTSMQKLGMPIHQSITTCAAVLYVDRKLSLSFIVDTNACALCTLISVAVNATRVGLDLDTTITNYIVGALWCLSACFFVCDLHRSFMRTLPVFEMSIFFTSFFCGIHGFLSMADEGDMFLYIRALIFTSFTVCWVYTERLHQVRDKQHFSFSPCLDRFGLMLLVEWYVFIAFSCVVLCLLIWRQSNWVHSEQVTIDEEIQLQVPHKMITNSVDLTSPPFTNENFLKKASQEPVGKGSIGSIRPMVEKGTEEEEIDVFAAFLIAKENARKGSHRQ